MKRIIQIGSAKIVRDVPQLFYKHLINVELISFKYNKPS